ncbi:MAG: DUF2007 domain-containing protein [Candidatus Binatia bacterium]
MKQVYIAQHPLDAHFVVGLLQSEGIVAVVRGESLFGVRGEVPATTETSPSVWIVDDSQFAQARSLVLTYSRGEMPAHAHGTSWRCPQCGEHLEPQFTVCWQCGRVRENTT